MIKLDNIIETCNRCHLASDNDKLLPQSGKGAGREYMLVGVAPSIARINQPTNNKVMPFGDKKFTSYWLGKILADLEISENQYYITNLIKCSIPNNDKPEEKDYSTCLRLFFWQELCLISPKKIICLGNIAYDILKQYENRIPFPIYKVFHHAYIARNSNSYDEWMRQWKYIIQK